MAHSIELLFDDATEDAIRREWAALAAAGLPSQAGHRSPTNRPHVTLAVSKRIDPIVDELLREQVAVLPLECRIGAVTVFGRGSVTLVRLIVPSDGLLRFQAGVADTCGPHQTPGPYAHSLPGQWTPHVTLSRRLPQADVPAALAVLAAESVAGRFAKLRRWDGDARVDTILG